MKLTAPLLFALCTSFAFGPVLRGQSAAEKIVNEGERITLTYSLGAGTPPFTHQWLKDGQPIAGATGANLVIPSATVADAGRYSVRVSNPAGATDSDQAGISILVRPKAAKTIVQTESPAK